MGFSLNTAGGVWLLPETLQRRLWATWATATSTSSWQDASFAPGSLHRSRTELLPRCDRLSQVLDPAKPEEMKEALRLNKLMIERCTACCRTLITRAVCHKPDRCFCRYRSAIKMEGTCTGEHGVGIGKKGYLPLELGESTVCSDP
jgi:hypothetical protein